METEDPSLSTPHHPSVWHTASRLHLSSTLALCKTWQRPSSQEDRIKADLYGDLVRPERGAEVDDQVQPALSVVIAEYRHADLLLGRRVWTAGRRAARRRARVCRPAVRVRRTVDSLQRVSPINHS